MKLKAAPFFCHFFTNQRIGVVCRYVVYSVKTLHYIAIFIRDPNLHLSPIVLMQLPPIPSLQKERGEFGKRHAVAVFILFLTLQLLASLIRASRGVLTCPEPALNPFLCQDLILTETPSRSNLSYKRCYSTGPFPTFRPACIRISSHKLLY